MKLSAFRKLIREEVRKATNEQRINEDMALVGDIALGVVGGLAGLWAIVKGIPVVVGALGMGASSLVDKMQDEAKKALAQARRQGRLETVKPIIAKFENDTKLKDMYKALPPYSTSTTAKGKESNILRTKQLQAIAKYVKSKLTPDEMQYFTDVSSMLRTGDIKEATLISKGAKAGTSAEIKVNDYIQWTGSENDRGMRVATGTYIGKVVKVIGSKNVQVEVVFPLTDEGDIYNVAKDESKRIPVVGEIINAKYSWNGGQGSGSQGSSTLAGTVTKVDLTNAKITVKNQEGKSVTASIRDLSNIMISK